MPFRLAAPAAVALLLSWPAHAGPPPPRTGSPPPRAGAPPPSSRPVTEELARVVSQRVEEATRIPLRIRKLGYEVFTSTFVAEGIEAGPRGAPLVRIPSLAVELSLLAGGSGLTIARIQARGVRATLDAPATARRLGLPRGLNRGVTVRAAALDGDEVALAWPGKRRAALRGLRLEAKGLIIPTTAAGQIPAIKGRVRLEARELRLGEWVVGELALEATLAPGRIQVARLVLRGPLGVLDAKGTIALAKGGRLGAIRITGAARWRASGPDAPGIDGTLELAGARPERLVLAGKFSSKGPAPLPRSGGLAGAPPLGLRLKFGPRSLVGSLERFRSR